MNWEENSKKLIQLDSRDNILIARQEIKKGEHLVIAEEEYVNTQTIKLGFKVASKKIEEGEKIIKYGTPIGSATAEIQIGEIIHLHNLKSDYSPTFTLQNQAEYDD